MKTFTTCAEKKAKQFLNLLQGYTKGIRTTAILILLLMGVGNAWAYDIKCTFIYDNSKTQWSSVQLMVGHSSWSQGYMMTQIANTQLWYYTFSNTWGGATQICVFNASSAWGGEGNSVSHRSSYMDQNTAVKNLSGNMTDGVQLITTTNGNDGTAMLTTYYSSYTGLNTNQNATVQSTTDGSTYSNNSNAGSVSISTYKLKSNTASETSTGTTSASAARTAVVTMTATAKTGYTFVGWYNSSGTQQTTSTTLTYNCSGSEATYYARFKAKTYTVTLDNQGATTAGAASVTATYNAAMPSIANNLPKKTGYTFNGYFDAESGGNQYYKDDGTSARSWNKTSNTTLYAQWTINSHDVTWKANGGNWSGSTADKVVTYNYGATIAEQAAPTRVGYEFAGWSPAFVANTTMPDNALTYTAQWTAKEYTVTLDNQGATTAGAASVTATYNAAMPSIANNLPKKTGYTFNGYFDAESGGNQYYKDDGTSARSWNKTSNTTLYAQWTINSHDVTWKANGGNWSGSTADKVVTYNYGATIAEQAAPTRVGYEFAGWSPAFVANTTMPDNDLTYTAQWTANQYTITLDKQGGTGGTSEVAVHYDNNDYSVNPVSVPSIQGYAFMGYYVAENGSGFQVVDATGNWVKSAHGYTDASGNWKKASDITLYAYFKKAEITSITLDKTLFESGETGYVTVTNHTIEPTPAGTVVVCWTLCYNNGTPVEGHEAIEEDGTVKFAIDGLSTGTYKVKASLRLNDCNGEELDTAEATFVVAGSYTVTIKYTCDGQEIAGRKTQEGYPSTPTEATAPEIGGYNFVAWVLGDGIYTTDELTSKTIKYTANYDGYLTATYEKKKLIFLDISTLPSKDKWSAPHVYLYSSNDYWDGTKGIGATKSQCVAEAAMVQVPTATDIWYYEYEGVLNFNGFVAFTATDKKSQEYFYDTEVIYRGDFSKGTPVFVPAEGQNAVSRNPSAGKDAKYYSKGHWTKYMGGTGYTLKIYNHKEVDGRKELMSVPFTGSSLYLPFTAIVDLEGGQTFGYKIVRDDDKWYKNDNDGTMTVNSHTNWPFIEDKNNGLACGIQTVAAGNHTFTLTLNATSGNFEVSVDYPVTVGDYRILYKDDTRSTYKPSDIKKAEELNPVTSFFIRPNSNPELKIQTATYISNGDVSWSTTNDDEIHFKPNANWKSDGARFAAYFYMGSTTKIWKDLTKNGDIYTCEKPGGCTHVIFCRMDPDVKTNSFDKGDGKPLWNQTRDLTLPTDKKNFYTLEEGAWRGQIYLKPNSNWTTDGARFAAYFYNGSKNEWHSMFKEDDGTYWCDIPEGYSQVIFCRMNPNVQDNNWNTGDDQPFWGMQTNDLQIPTNSNDLYTITNGQNKPTGAWSCKSWNEINTGSITDLTEELKEKLGEIKGDIKDAPDSVYTIHLSNNEGTLTIEKVAFYTGNFYIRVDAAAGKWYGYKTNPDNLMTYSAFSESDANSFGEKFSHYKTKWCPRGTNVKFVIANDYSPCISDTLARDLVRASGEDYMTEGGELYQEDGGAKDPVYDRYSANIRFMWNRKTNKISRAYLASSSNDNRQFLVLKGCQEIKDENGNNLSGNGDNHGEFRALLQDTQNWIYERTFKVRPGTRVKLYACYADATVGPATAQYFRGAYDSNQCGSTENSVQILGGNGEDWEKIRVIYDFKTNRLMGAWVPESAIDSEQAIAADLMVIRRHQENATCVTLTNENSKLTDVKTAYGAMQFNRWTINNRGGADDLDVDHCTKLSGSHRVYDETITNQYHPVLPLAEQTSIYERGLYFISFPFDVHLSDVFGFGTYGTHWVISTYNGKRRAERGYFAEDCINEDCTNWDYIWDPTGFVMKANEGYLLSLDLDLMKHDNTSFWANNISQVELFFPSTAAVKSIEKTDYTMPALTEEYLCKINHNTPDGDRRVKDSYWRCIGVPSFADYDGSLTTDGNNTINWKADYTWKADNGAFPFLYEWNVTNNDLVVRSTNSYKFRATYAYLIQNGNEIHWEAVNTNKPASIIARDQTENMSNYEWKIALLRNDAPADHTFIRMTDNESVTSAFDFHQDLAKEFNYGANIYTLVGYERLAANSLPMSDSTTIIPLGVSAQEAGDYTIAMPEGVENIGITLVDNETGIHTNLSAGQEYTLTLNKGICENRLFIEVSPIQNTPTDLEYTTEDTREQTTRKMLIDGMLYLIRDGVIYDAQGHRL